MCRTPSVTGSRERAGETDTGVQGTEFIRPGTLTLSWAHRVSEKECVTKNSPLLGTASGFVLVWLVKLLVLGKQRR